MKYISSPQNSLIKELRQLKQKKYRDRAGLFVIEGEKLVEEARKESNGLIKEIIVSESYNRENDTEISQWNDKYSISLIPDRLFNEIADTESPQGIIAMVEKRATKPEDMLHAGSNTILILDALQDPGNLGTIIRTADAGGVSGIILGPGCVDLYNPKVLRSTMGSVFHVPVCNSDNITMTIDYLKQKGFTIYASHLKGTHNLFEIDFPSNTAIIIGNEANGIGQEAEAKADILLKIPMPGKAESLNASVAAALMIFEVARKNFIR
ncbi:MAG TPA: RNA methyltransferase [Clostridiaceae bacterium]|nr:RNA methyltransferase [Clostridiaceae bacterium]